MVNMCCCSDCPKHSRVQGKANFGQGVHRRKGKSTVEEPPEYITPEIVAKSICSMICTAPKNTGGTGDARGDSGGGDPTVE